jgi:hypothetical protein
MTRKLYLLLIGAVVSGVLVAACGGGGSSTSSTSSTPSTTSSASTHAATTTSSSTPTSTTSSSTTTSSKTAATTSTKSSTTSAATTPSGSNPAIVAICKAEIQKLASAVLTSDEKAQLNHLCDVAGSGNTAQIKAAEKQICLTVIKDSAPGLSGTALTAAQQSCSKVGQTPAG